MKRLFALILFTLLAAHLGATDYYVTAGAGGTNSGTQANPWKTLSAIVQSSLVGDDVVHWSGTFNEEYDIAKGGTSGHPIIYKSDGAQAIIQKGIQGLGFDNITILNTEFTQPTTAYVFPCIYLVSGCDGWTIEDCYFFTTYSSGIEMHTTKCNNMVVRHCTFDLISWTDLGSQTGTAITATGDNMLIEYNLFARTLDRIYTGAGTGMVVRNNTFTKSDASLWTNVPSYPFHVDDLQGGISLTKFIFERNWDVDNLETVGGNAHHFLMQDQEVTNTVNWLTHRFNVTIRNGGIYLSNIIEWYDYSNTWIGMLPSEPSPAAAYAWRDPSAPNSNNANWLGSTWSICPKVLTTGDGIFGTGDGQFPVTKTSAYMHSWNSGSAGALLIPSGTNLGHVDPLFTDGTNTALHDDYTLQSGSPLRNAGHGITTVDATDAGSGTTLKVVNARAIFDGYGVADADWIKVGSNPYQKVVSANYTASPNTITLTSGITRASGDQVLVKGQEDIGGLPFTYVTTIMNGTASTGTASPTTLSGSTTTIEDVRKVEWLFNKVPVASANYTGSSPLTASYTPSGRGVLETRFYNYWASAAYQTVSAFQLINQDPTVLANGSATSTTIPYTWIDNSGGLATYSIETSLDNVTFTVNNVTAAGAVSGTATGLASSTLYYARVRALIGGVYSGPSNTVSTTTASAGGSSAAGLGGKLVIGGKVVVQ